MKKNNSYIIPERFEKAITLHIIRNLLSESQNVFIPLLLGIHGASGEGKTFQCQLVLEKIGCQPFLISGGQLESYAAGEPAKLIRQSYLDAGDYIKKENSLAVVLINDIDAGIGNWGDMVQYTVNRQTVFGELMHLVDYPNMVDRTPTRRIPIIITGNDFTKLYEPLVRTGRMIPFEWEPSFSEKIEIVARIFPEIDRRDISNLVNDFREQPVAFFSHLRAIIADEILWEQTKSRGVQFILQDIQKGLFHQPPASLSYENLVKTGRELLKSSTLTNHLGK